MPRKHKLTWQPGTNGRKGRWRKRYRGQVYYFSGGRGKSDREAYEAALRTWERQKTEIDAQSPKPHQQQYEQAIAQWESVLAWSRTHHEDGMAEEALTKIESLTKALSAATPEPVDKADTFAGRFDHELRYPGWNKILADFEQTAFSEPQHSNGFHDIPGSDDYLAAIKKLRNGIADSSTNGGIRTEIVPAETGLNTPAPLAMEREIWRDRLDVMRRSASLVENTLKAHIAKFLEDKRANMAAGLLTAGRVEKLRSQLEQFQLWAGSDLPLTEIVSQTLIDYRVHLLQLVEAEKWSRTTANERMGTVRTFVHWLWQVEAISTLPRVLDGKTKTLEIGNSCSPIVVFTTEEIERLLKNATTRTALYILLMLNTGMTQKDISDLDFSEVDWDAGRILRKRSKTRHHEGVPQVDYLLWPETLRLLRQERCSRSSGCVLLNEGGRPLWSEEILDDGKYRKNDNVRNAFGRLARKLEIAKPLKSLKKTSATKIRGHQSYRGLEDLFLGHAPQKISDQHYAQSPTSMLDKAISWLREEYGIEKIVSGSEMSPPH